MTQVSQCTNINISVVKTSRRIIALTVILPFIVLTACAFHEPVNLSSNLKNAGFHTQVKQGLVSTVKLKTNTATNHWQKNIQVAIMPAGPYVSHRFSLDYQPAAVASDGNYAYVASHSSKDDITSSNLQIFQFIANGQTKLLANIREINGEVSQLNYANGYLLLLMKQGGFITINVTQPASPTISLNYPTKSPVLDAQFNGNTAYLLLENNLLLEMSLASRPAGNQAANLLHSWELPVDARAITVHKDIVFLVGTQGVATVKLSNKSTNLIDLHKTSGIPVDIKLHNSLALVTDGPGGLLVFSISETGQLRWAGSYNKRGPITQLSMTKNGVLATLENESVMSIGLTNPELPNSGPAFKPGDAILATAVHSSDSQNDAVLLVTTNLLQRVVMADDGGRAISPEGINQGGSRRGVIRDNILYVADWFSGLHLYDISIPQQPRHLSNYHTPGSSKGVILKGNYALIGDDDQGLQIIDIEDPHRPRWVSELSPESLSKVGLAYTMKLVGDILYLADHRGGFHIIDLGDIFHPKRLGGYDTPGKSWGIDVFNNFVFVADDRSGLLVFDASNTAKPELVGQFDPGGQAEDVAIQNGLAYVTFFDKGLYVLDIQNPRQLKVTGHTPIPGNARGIELADGLAYIAGWESGLHIIDTRGPDTPHIIGSFDTDGAAWGVNTKNGYAYVLDWWGGIKVIDVRQPSRPTYVGQYHARDTLQQLRAKNKYLYAASGSGGLQIFDIKNPLNPIWTTGVDFNGQAQDVWFEESRAYVATGDGGVVILDILDPFYSRRIGLVATPGQAQRVRAWNETLYIQDSQAGLIIVDVRDPQRPQEIARYPIQIRDIWVDDSALWISTSKGLNWWRHSDNGALNNKNLQPISGGSSWVRTLDDLVATAHENGAISLWRITPRGLVPLGEYQAGESISDLQLDQQVIYILGKRSGLMAINISDPKTPRLTALYPATGRHTRFEIADGAAFFAGESRLASVTLLPTTISIQASPDGLEIRLPADLPTGKYHLLLTTANGHRELLPNALSVQFSTVNSGKSPLENMRDMLKTPKKSSAEP